MFTWNRATQNKNWYWSKLVSQNSWILCWSTMRLNLHWQKLTFFGHNTSAVCNTVLHEFFMKARGTSLRPNWCSNLEEWDKRCAVAVQTASGQHQTSLLTSVLETIRKLPLAKAQTALRKQNKKYGRTIFNMADGILTPCSVARSWHWFYQVTAPCNMACGMALGSWQWIHQVAVGLPCNVTRHVALGWHVTGFAMWQHPAMWHVALQSATQFFMKARGTSLRTKLVLELRRMR